MFYGWWNVFASFVGLALSYAMFTVFAFGTFVTPLQAEFGWQRGPMSFALTIANIAVVIASPLLGGLVDRVGVRRVMVISVAAMGLCVSSMSLLTGDIRHYYLMHLLIPLLGAGTLPLAYSRIIVLWFERRRGLALGIALSGFGVGATLIPTLAQWMIELWGWRQAYLVFGGLIFCISLPLSGFLIREKPADMGLYPDGAQPAPDSCPAPAAAQPLAGLSFWRAARVGTFWYIAVSFLLVGVGITSILGHLVPLLIGRGVEPVMASVCMSLLGFGLIFGRLLSGLLLDHYFAPYVAALFLVGLLAGIVILALDSSGPEVFLAAFLVGLATGSEISEIAYIVSRYFGVRAFGLIYGFMFAAFQLGAAVGAYAMGAYYDLAGNYLGALWAAAGLVFFGIVLILLLGPYPGNELQAPSGVAHCLRPEPDRLTRS